MMRISLPVLTVSVSRVFIALSFALAIVPSLEAAAIRTVVVTGVSPPGGGSYDGFSATAIDADGDASFSSLLLSGERGLFREQSGGILELIREGDIVPGTGGGALNGFFAPRYNIEGRGTARGTLTGGSVNQALLLDTGIGWEPIAQPGDSVGTGLTLDSIAEVSVNNSKNYVTWTGDVDTGSGLVQGVFRGNSSSTELVARTGGGPTPVSGVDLAVVSNRPRVGDNGQMVFYVELEQGGSVTTSNNDGLAFFDGTDLRMLMREGDSIGAIPGATFTDTIIGRPHINADGDTVFQGTFQGGAVTAANDTAIFREEGGTLRVLAREGSSANVPEGGGTFSTFFSSGLVSNLLNETMFRANITGVAADRDTGIWMEDGHGQVRPFVREGDPVPGMPAGTVFSYFSGVVLSEGGQLAFEAGFTGTVTGGGIFSSDHYDRIDLVTDINSQLEGRDISSLSLHAGQQQTSGVNDTGQLSFVANFTNGTSGVFVATPDPDTSEPNFFAEMITGSPVSISKIVSTPSSDFDLEFDYLFTTTTGQLQVTLDGSVLETIDAPGSIASGFTQHSISISTPLLDLNDVILKLEFDGPTGSRLLLDDIVFPESVNGQFQTGDLFGWLTEVSASGSVQVSDSITLAVVPEPSSAVALCVLLSCWALGRRKRRSLTGVHW